MNILDQVIGFFNPAAGLRRVQSRMAMEMVSRKYDAAADGRRNGGWWRPKTTAREETSVAADKLANTAQELCRNSPLAQRIKLTWASNIAGLGIRADIQLSNKAARKKFNADFDSWAGSTECDFDGQYNLYGLQWLISAVMVETGGAIVRRHVVADADAAIPLKLQVLEQTMLDASQQTPSVAGHKVQSGVEFDKFGVIYGWHVKGQHPDEDIPQTIFLRKGVDAIHIYRKERPGQHLGISWLTQIATTLRKYDTLIDAKLMQDQIAACLGLIIEEANSAIGLNSDKNQTRIGEIEPAMVEYVAAGTKVHTITPPSSQGSNAFMEVIRSDLATGVGLSHPQLTGDYSQMNFSSGRMSKLEFFQLLDIYQGHIIEPALNQIFEWSKALYGLNKRSNIRSATVSWVYPPRAFVQPKEELDVLIKKVRSGMESPITACKSFGNDLETIVEQWIQSKEIFGDLPFDIDPSKFSDAGNQLNTDDAASSNVASDQPPTNSSD